jgi:hypothetical protein
VALGADPGPHPRYPLGGVTRSQSRDRSCRREVLTGHGDGEREQRFGPSISPTRTAMLVRAADVRCGGAHLQRGA